MSGSLRSNRFRLSIAVAGSSIAAFAVVAACGGGEEATTQDPASQGEAQQGSATSSAPAQLQGEHPAGAAGLQMQQDLLAIAHLADVDREGLYIDFGTPARHKYITGGYSTGWGSDGADGDETFTHAAEAARLYFPVRSAGPITLRLRMRAIGSRRLQVFVNNESLPEGIQLASDDAFHDYDVAVPASLVRAGENYVLLRFGGTQRVGDENVAVAMSSVRVIPGTPAAGEYLAPDHGSLVAQVEVGGTERRALAIRGPAVVTYHVQVPANGRLVLGVGVEGEPGDARARVVAQAEGGEAQELFSAALTQRWNDQAIDLAALAGQVVRIDLVAEGSSRGRVAWSEPAIMVPPPQLASLPEVRNVIVLLIDTLRASKLRAYNPRSRVRTPVLDRLVQEGTIFEQAQSQEDWTKPSVASVLTGLSPITHRAFMQESRLSESAEMVSEVFDEAGFTTGTFLANGYVSDRYGFAQGWDFYTNLIREERNTDAENVFREAGTYIEQHRSERFFIYIQTIDPHVPYDPPAELLAMYDDRTDYAGQVRPRMTPDLLERAKRTPPAVTFDASDVRRLEALHDGEITYHDRELGRFLERLAQMGVLDQTLIVVTSDHGEEFNDHGSWGHGHSVYQELIGVPLVFWRPGVVPAGLRVQHSVSTISISPTVLELAGVRPLRRAEGPSLVPVLRGDVPQGPQVAFSHHQEERRVIRAGRWKLVVRGVNHTLFDLERDPGEQNELDVRRYPIATRFLRAMIGQYLGAQDRSQWLSAEQRRGEELRGESIAVDEAECARLRALGYACTGVGEGAPSAIGQTD